MSANNDPDRDAIVAQAARWHVAAQGDDMDWDGFTAWLEASPENRACYQHVALVDAELVDRREEIRAAVASRSLPEAPASPGRRRGWAIGAVAAMMVAALSLPLLLRGHETEYATGAASRTIAFADGSSVVLAPHSRLVVDGPHPRHMRMSGGAWFAIRHQPDRSLEIAAGALTIRDIGTRFDVQADGSHVRVGVADGQVAVVSAALDKPVALQEGKELIYDGAGGIAETQDIDPALSGAWRHGELRYNHMPLSLVAVDLARYAGIRLTVPAELQGRRFTGILSIKDAQGTTRDLAQLMGLTLVHGANGDRLSVSGH